MDQLKTTYFQIEKALFWMLLPVFGVLLLNSFGLLHWTIPCGIKHFLHLECFGCGTSRAILLMWQGDFSASWQSNPLGILIQIFIAIRLIQLFYTKIKAI